MIYLWASKGLFHAEHGAGELMAVSSLEASSLQWEQDRALRGKCQRWVTCAAPTVPRTE